MSLQRIHIRLIKKNMLTLLKLMYSNLVFTNTYLKQLIRRVDMFKCLDTKYIFWCVLEEYLYCNINSGKPPNVTLMTMILLECHRIISRFYFITESYFITTLRYLYCTIVHKILCQRIQEKMKELEGNNETIPKFQMDTKLIWSLSPAICSFYLF